MTRLATLFMTGGGVCAIAGIVASVKAQATKAQTAEASRSGGTVKLHLTGYWPFAAKTDVERKMEGGADGAAAWNGRRVVDPNTNKRVQLHTLEQHLADPAAHPFVALSGDPEVWPFGQRIVIDAWPTAVARVVDTGGHFKGAGKVYRVMGEEPIDVCVNSKDTKVLAKATGRVPAGDNWEGGKAIAAANLKGQTYVSGLDLLGVR